MAPKNILVNFSAMFKKLKNIALEDGKLLQWIENCYSDMKMQQRIENCCRARNYCRGKKVAAEAKHCC
jgi:hypothetical protein